MEKTTIVAIVLAVAVVFCFGSVSMVEAKGPIWQIYRAGTNRSIPWKTHAANPRFAKWKAGTNGDTSDDIVLDRETGLVWARDAFLTAGTENWITAVTFCRDLRLGNRKGWRLPTAEELGSLIGPAQAGLDLPVGHPFKNVQSSEYWSSTTMEDDDTEAWDVHMGSGAVSNISKSSPDYVWPVRGGNGYATGYW